MTYDEQYKEVANYILNTWTTTPALVRGEVVKVTAPYVIVDTYSIGMENGFTCKSNTQGNKISCYETDPRKCMKLMSDVQELFYNRRTPNLTLERVRIDGAIIKLNDNLYQGVVKFTTRS